MEVGLGAQVRRSAVETTIRRPVRLVFGLLAQAAVMKLQKHASSSDQEQYQHDRACFRQLWKTGDEDVSGSLAG